MRAGAAPLLGTRLRLWSTDPSRGDSIEQTLSDVLGEPVTVSVRLGPPRANRKPVLHVLSARAEVVAVAKLGTTDLARKLVAAEAAALRLLGERAWSLITVPRLLHDGDWHDMSLLVQSPLLASRPRKLAPARRVAAMREVAESGAVHRIPVAGSAYVEGLARRIDLLPDTVLATRMQAALQLMTGGSLPFGTWHGDWTDWNTAAGDGTVLIWDWERLATPVPVGFDAVHYAAQPAITRAGGPTPEHARELVATAPGLLAPFDLGPAEARTTAALYLLEIGVRYATDGQAAAGVPAGRVDAWILPAIEPDPAMTPDSR
jgi:hypothetical protein